MSSLPSTTSAKIKPWMIYACGALGVGLLVGWGACWLIRHQPTASHEIDWSGYAALWGAFATFITGMCAVGGASYIGYRQLKIQHTQTKVQLLDRRVESIEKIDTFIKTHIQNLDPMSLDDTATIRKDLMLAKLIFPKEISDDFDKCFQMTYFLKNNVLFHASSLALEVTNPNCSKELLAKYQEANTSYMRLQTEVTNALIDLSDGMQAHARVDL